MYVYKFLRFARVLNMIVAVIDVECTLAMWSYLGKPQMAEEEKTVESWMQGGR